MSPRSLLYLLGLIGLSLLVGCNGRGTPAPTPAPPAATTEPTPTAASAPSVAEPTSTAVPSPATGTSTPSPTADLLEDLEAIDTALQEIDNQVCQEALETRADIEELLRAGQDVSDLAAAIDELIAELEGCSLMPTPTP